MDYQSLLEDIHRAVRPVIGQGRLADYIAPLAAVPRDRFGMALQTVCGDAYRIGDAGEAFSIQSISKLFALTLALRHAGAALWRRIGREPSGSAFNSLVQLEYEKGIPRNPFINAGALVLADVILAHSDSPHRDFLAFLRQLSATPTLSSDPGIHRAETASGHRNRALANLLKDFGNLHHTVDDVLDFYNFQCATMMDCVALTSACLYLANRGLSAAGARVVSQRQAKRINAVMLTCGTYDAAGDFAYRVGLPGKSGVGGGIVAVVPDRFSLCVWSPALNAAGNSHAGTKALELFTTKARCSIF